MKAPTTRVARCAIYTRKSTEHGLELEFNSLDAQREACEAYIKSQSSEGWKSLSKRYDDPAFSGGNMERPALQCLLKDIEAGLIDVIVVYKIDRLTRSLADFAKLVEVFDARSVSFVAVTQQFNTTTSMGRLTLNVLLSFAQFERELSSERVRDKFAASRKKGKWMGGSVPLGYDVIDKKLVINKNDAKIVRYIFDRYLEAKSFRTLVDDLNSKQIFTKKRILTDKRAVGGIRFTYGPLAYLLKNQVYIGKTTHRNASFSGEHDPIIDLSTFDKVQALLKRNSIQRHVMRSESESILGGLLYDDRGNRMSPSFSTKNNVRHRYYVSSALLRGKRESVGSLSRVSASAIESKVIAAVRAQTSDVIGNFDGERLKKCLAHIVLSKEAVHITLKENGENTDQTEFSIPWQIPFESTARIEGDDEPAAKKRNQILIQAIARAHHWIQMLESGQYESIEDLAAAKDIHPKVIREMSRFAFLSPTITSAILDGRQPVSMTQKSLKKVAVLSWTAQIQTCGLNRGANQVNRLGPA
jgi:site-specific DNA recombinase